ncbi:hypothetical protein G3I60_20100 [Streptomyces sp. SID13666]|uniref:hypothetical protein n=1 Tax=Streptomyces sp. SID13666 TaxID=2706054 RepID=UPI0013BFFFEF|nr:hypothetical protein [Streptomyces sp. SID13666]NEA56384.1 hypothetical protein [Streptomyces sp. SID13666]
MAIVSRKVSDLSGQEGTDAEFATVVVRQHPSIDQPKALDVLAIEAEQFKEIGDLVVIEVTMPNGSRKDVAMKRADFDKLAPNMDEVLKAARGTRGRVPGTRIGNG